MNLNIDTIKLQLPSKLEDICQFSFNFDNLMKVIEYLFNNTVIIIKETKELRTRVSDLEYLQSEIDKLKIKTFSIEKANDTINRGFIDIKERFIKSESKVSEIIKKNEELQNIMEKNEKILDKHDININNLNKVVEENIKSIKQIQENFGINLTKMHKFEEEIKDIHRENIKTHELIEKNNNHFIQEQNTNEKQIESLNSNISEINESINSIKKNFDKKYRDFDNCLNNVMDTIKDLSSKGISNQQNEKNLFKLSMNEIEREREKFNSFIEEHKHMQEKKDKENETFKKIIDSLKIDVDNINNKINNVTLSKQNNEEKKEDKQYKDLEDKFVNNESFNKLNEYIKSLTKTISTLPNREEFESLTRNLLSKIIIKSE